MKVRETVKLYQPVDAKGIKLYFTVAEMGLKVGASM